eukprot:TRINITY_DN8243_c0_g1_i3.p1 TRINITY_DN8243_c0_g1~~TRINITY_DN8243_c0_g1_i3.p1  ORF type:complete len:288 (+),score=77.64 TRINITY_DN8243_c0_g1_i3:109-972(+)
MFFFFFFKQKTAYEMLRSLVGSEMCIRDRVSTQSTGVLAASPMSGRGEQLSHSQIPPEDRREIYRLGVEICGVLMPPADQFDNTSFYNSENPDEYRRAPLAEDAAKAMRKLCELFDDVYLVCNVSRFARTEGVRDRVMSWLEAIDFYSRTGQKPENVHFCETIDDKAALCQDLYLTHMVDTNVRALEMCAGIVMQRFLMDPPFKELEKQETEHVNKTLRLQKVPKKAPSRPKDYSTGDARIRAVRGWYHFSTLFIRTKFGIGEFDEQQLAQQIAQHSDEGTIAAIEF